MTRTCYSCIKFYLEDVLIIGILHVQLGHTAGFTCHKHLELQFLLDHFKFWACQEAMKKHNLIAKNLDKICMLKFFFTGLKNVELETSKKQQSTSKSKQKLLFQSQKHKSCFRTTECTLFKWTHKFWFVIYRITGYICLCCADCRSVYCRRIIQLFISNTYFFDFR